MSVQPTAVELSPSSATARPARHRFRAMRSVWRMARWPLLFFLVIELVGGGSLSALQERNTRIGAAVSGHNFDFVRWEAAAIREKAAAQLDRPADALTLNEATSLVKLYLERASDIRSLERKINDILARTGGQQTAGTHRLQEEIDGLRAQQQLDRATVEQVIESQIARVLVDEGLRVGDFSFPPVFFTFTEPPKKLIVSPRERITTAYSQMLDATISLEEIENAETNIEAESGLSAYVTNVGGLGAYPAMVVDRASLPWILSTVAHEWTHNYLTLFPLGLLYNADPDLTTINETVADMVGDEISARALQMYYPESVPPPLPPSSAPAADDHAPIFDFNAEMRQTRETVDKLLYFGRVADAEKYMELRRQLFVENGFPIRKLNQAYFAFHGSYGGSPASVSPLYPKLARLRELTPDVRTFLAQVRGVTSVAELDERLAKWESHE